MLVAYILKRIVQMVPLLLAITVIVFVIIQLPPGDYLTTYIRQLELQGNMVDQGEIQALRNQYGLDKPGYVQYFIWIRNILTRGDFGRSFGWNQPVSRVIGDRLGATMLVSFGSLVFVWLVSIPIGIYSATHQYSPGDYIFTFLGFIGLSVPGFLIALFVIYFTYVQTGIVISGLFSQEFQLEPWGIPKFLNMLPRLAALIFIIGMQNTAGMIRTTRAMMLDELGKQYVITARAKGVAENKLLFKYPVRVAINPLISTVGWALASLISGEVIVSIVFNMPTTGPILLTALMTQDMYLAGSFLLIISVFTVVGTLLSDILLAVIDPRIRFGGVTE
jgi:peptide/nickel transport system permease protein